MSEINRVITLAAHPVGFPSETDFKLIEEPKPAPGDGQFLIRTRFVSVDPYMRGRMNGQRDYADPFEIGKGITTRFLHDAADSSGLGTGIPRPTVRTGIPAGHTRRQHLTNRMRPIRGRRRFFDPLADRILGPGFRSTIVKEDTRLPTMDIGLGVWTESEALYYPMEAVQAAGGAIVDDFDGRRLLVYVEPGTYSVDAFFTEEETVIVEDSRLTVGEELVLESGVLRDAGGDRLEMERPLQLFSRWYGFALTFPGTAIYMP